MPWNFVPVSFHTGVTAEALRAKINRKSAISHQRGHFDQKFQVQGVAPTNNFCTVSWASERCTRFTTHYLGKTHFPHYFSKLWKLLWHFISAFKVLSAGCSDINKQRLFVSASWKQFLRCLFRHLPKIALLAFNAFCLGTAVLTDRRHWRTWLASSAINDFSQPRKVGAGRRCSRHT